MSSPDSFQSLLCEACLVFLKGHWCQKPYEHPPNALHWVQVRNSKSDGEIIEPLHHAICGLRESMQKGCPLCGIIFGLFDPADAAELEAYENFSQRKGKMEYELEPWYPDIKARFTYSSAGCLYMFELTFGPLTGKPYVPDGESLVTLEAGVLKPYQGHIPRNTFSEESLHQIKCWLNDCEMSHPSCVLYSKKHQGTRCLPTRLVDVGTPDSPTSRLILGSTVSVDSNYFTLSHCWGGKPLLCLTTENLGKFNKQIGMHLMPRTFREAISITRMLGVRYLWMDALCILQDSLKDWEHESSLMSQVYANAQLNIAAAASSNGAQGLYRKWDPRNVGACVVQPLWTGLGDLYPEYICCHSNLWAQNITHAPLQQRCWVLQERLLSPRIIHYAQDQLFWECSTLVASESMPMGLPVSMFDPLKAWQSGIEHCDVKSKRLLLQNRWPEIVQAYCRGELSYSTDKLVAISGIATQMIQHWGGSPADFLAGHWREALPHELLWRVDMNSRGKILDHYRAPSWSWASLDAKVLVPSLSVPNLVLESYEQLVKVLEAEVEPSGTLLSCNSGYLRLQGPMCRVTLVVSISKTGPPMPDDSLNTPTPVRNWGWFLNGEKLPDYETYMDAGTYYVVEEVREKVYYFIGFFNIILTNPQTKWLTGMILEPTGIADGQYRRAGVFSVEQEIAIEKIRAAFKNQPMERQEYEHQHQDATYSIQII